MAPLFCALIVLVSVFLVSDLSVLLLERTSVLLVLHLLVYSVGTILPFVLLVLGLNQTETALKLTGHLAT